MFRTLYLIGIFNVVARFAEENFGNLNVVLWHFGERCDLAFGD